MKRTIWNSRAGWAQTLTLGAMALVAAAGAVVSAGGSRSETGRGLEKGVRAEGSAPESELIAELSESLAKVDAKARAMIEKRVARSLAAPNAARMSACFTPGTPNEVMEAFRATEARLNHLNDRFQIAPRWGATAYTPGGSSLGKPVTVSYSIVPDGTDVAGFNGEGDNPSNLRAYLNGIYGSEAAWLPLVKSVFDRWSQVSGITYVYEANDDGQPLSDVEGFSPFFGVPGVRGDVRISGHPIDGGSGVLAYNFYPDSSDALGGDMVIDTGDTFFANTANGAVALRNVLSHEHGHGMGQAHVCPIETTKLMEPFVSVIFDGPRQDDIRHAQYSYGDVNEPNDFAAEATVLGLIDCVPIALGGMPEPVGPVAGAITENPIASTLSISDTNDDDFYAVTVGGASRITVKAIPVGSTYDDSAQACSGQSGSCCSGNPVNALATVDLAVNVLAPDGSGLLASASGAPAGQTETAVDVLLPDAGTYYVQVKAAGATSMSQFYTLNISSKSAQLVASVSDASQAAVSAGALVPVAMTINNGTEQFDFGASKFYYAFGLDAPTEYLEAPIYDHGGGAYVAAIPDVPCGTLVHFYAELRTTSDSVVRLPACDGGYVASTGSVTDVYSTDFTTNAAGWVVGPNSATAGLWENVVPIGTAAAPGADHTGPGGQCFVTGQGVVGGSVGAADVDGGSTLLTSPTLNMAGHQNGVITYWRWYSTGAGSAPYADTFVVQVSTNGGSNWVTAETVGPGSLASAQVNPGWRFGSIVLSSLGLTPTANVKVRFNAQDTGSGSVVEAAIDDFAVKGTSCMPTDWCEGDLNLDGVVEDMDFVVFAQAYGVLECADPLMSAGCPSDLNGDGIVEDSDFVEFAAAYNGLVCP